MRQTWNNCVAHGKARKSWSFCVFSSSSPGNQPSVSGLPMTVVKSYSFVIFRSTLFCSSCYGWAILRYPLEHENIKHDKSNIVIFCSRFYEACFSEGAFISWLFVCYICLSHKQYFVYRNTSIFLYSVVSVGRHFRIPWVIRRQAFSTLYLLVRWALPDHRCILHWHATRYTVAGQ